MPPRRSASSKELGPHLSQTATATERALYRPTTTRALGLRNGKYGTMGTGELVPLRRKLTGKEKLDLLAEDLARRAILSPFRLEQCIVIASSQYGAYLDNIANLKDSALFCDIIKAELDARSPLDPQQKLSALQNPSYIASIIATRQVDVIEPMIHNLYMLAAGWRIVRDTLIEFAVSGLADDNVKTKLKNNHQFRQRYLTLYDMVGILVHLSQSQTSVLATTTPHYAQYFRKVEDSAPDEQDVQFDWNGLREACLSFTDSIIVELCFPRPSFPRDILFSLLRDAVEETPKETRRFPQVFWDAIGDFSTSVELQSLLEAGLLGPNEKRWKDTPRVELERYERWLDAHYQSDNASNMYDNWQDLIYPLDNTKEQSVLDEIWRLINSNYRMVAGKGMDELWTLSGELDIVPQWHALYVHDPNGEFDPGTEISKEEKKALTLRREGSMPDLRVSSESSESDESDYEGSGYDTDEDEEFRGLLRVAMENVHGLEKSSDPPAWEASDANNPFVKFLGSLGGRLFSSNAKLRVEREKTGTAIDREQNAVDEVDEEGTGETSQAPKKKKKKRKPRKKPVPEHSSLHVLNVVPESPQVIPSRTTKTSDSGKQLSNALPLPVEPTVAQSARSYIKAEQLDIHKSKVKSRSDQASIFSNGDKEDKKGMFAKFHLRNVKDTGEEEQRRAKQSWFSRLSKRATSCMHQLLRTSQDEKQGLAPMKWDHFVALMVEMGFTYDPATAGSSVRFVPPDKRDRPISIHKPHPNPTLQPIKLKEIASRLRRYYGWNKDDFLAQAR
ncbi:hypothetical protein F5887DRAFT_880568 [Amanita rubescens]|nr:hypothetical protein F5887DRAFT_880568 [Amanita rubescens]